MTRARKTHPDGLLLKDLVCSVEECDRLCLKGMWLEDFSPLCHMHATRWRRTGDPMKVKSTRGRVFGIDREEDFYKRFMAQLEIGDVSEDGYTRHLLYTGFKTKTPSGDYGRQFKTVDGKLVGILAHRYLYEQWVGPIPEGMDLDHRPECPKNCVNPAHLEPRTKSEHAAVEAARRGPIKNSEMLYRAWDTRRGEVT